MANNLDPDQVRHFVEPDLHLNCFQGLPVNGTSMQRNKQTASSPVAAIAEQNPLLETYYSLDLL